MSFILEHAQFKFHKKHEERSQFYVQFINNQYKGLFKINIP